MVKKMFLNQRLSKWFEENSVLANEQNGFRKKKSCLEHIYTLYTIVNDRKIARQNTYAAFIDLRKAFDNVDRDCLWYKLCRTGVSGKIYSSIKSMYEEVQCSVRVNNNMTDPFYVKQGVKQGCPLSPTLFSLYINDLAEDINNLECGITVDTITLSILLFADDIVLLAPSEACLQTMLNAVHMWSNKWRLDVNMSKSNIIHFRNKNTQITDYQFVCGQHDILLSSKYKYLGLWFNEHLDMKFTTKELAKSAHRALACLHSKVISSGGMSHAIYTKLYEALVQPVLFYASAIWGICEHSCINHVQNRACRFFLGLPRHTSNCASRGDMGWKSCLTKQRVEVIRFFYEAQR